jgi:hypothetical protein
LHFWSFLVERTGLPQVLFGTLKTKRLGRLPKNRSKQSEPMLLPSGTGCSLDELFDITVADKEGNLSFWLAEPGKHAKERFGLRQEVLVIHSPHRFATDDRNREADVFSQV